MNFSLPEYARQSVNAAAAMRTRGQHWRPLLEGDSFPKQWDYITSTARFKTLKCSRRAGKTSGTVRRVFKQITERPGFRVLYINLTATNAEQQFFKPLLEMLKARGVQHRPDNNDLMIYVGNGSYVRAMGCDNVGEVKTKLGDFWDEIYVDEMQSYSDDVLVDLVDRAALPTLIDHKGSMTCMGTPAVTKAGYWYRLYKTSKWIHFFWTLLDNPHIQSTLADIIEQYDQRGIKPTDIIFRREVGGEDVVDPEAVVFKYESPRNDLPAVMSTTKRWSMLSTDNMRTFTETMRIEPNHPAWRYVVGMDMGFSDHDAIVVLGWRTDDPEHHLYEVFTWQERHLDYLKMADVYKRVVEHYMPVEVCIDTGGHGARKIVESLKAAFGAFKYRLKPASLLDSISLLNDEFRSGRLLVDHDGLVAHDANLVVWKEGKHEVEISESFHSDVMAACRYAHSCAYHYVSEAPAPEETDEDRWTREWRQRQDAINDPYSPYRERGGGLFE